MSLPHVRSKLVLLGAAIAFCAPALAAQSQAPRRALLPIDFTQSAEHGWLAKPVLARRVLDDHTRPGTWTLSGAGTLTVLPAPVLGDMRALRVDMRLNRAPDLPTIAS